MGVVLEVRKLRSFIRQSARYKAIVLVGKHFPELPPIAVLLHGISDLKVIVISANK